MKSIKKIKYYQNLLNKLNKNKNKILQNYSIFI